MATKAIVVLSGGQDSTTCLYWAKVNGYGVHTVTFDYGQRHSREIDCAKHIADRAGVTNEIIHLGAGILKGTSPLVSEEKLETYKDSASLPGGLEKTFVPMRNQLFLTVAANRAAVLGAKVLITGVCEEDYGGYPDCREIFICALEMACNRGTFTGEKGTPEPLMIMTPLMHLTKAQTVKLSLQLEGCYASLAWTHTAYDGRATPDGKDHASLLRAKGFEEAGIPDPLVVRYALKDSSFKLPKTSNYNLSNQDWKKYLKLAKLESAFGIGEE